MRAPRNMQDTVYIQKILASGQSAKQKAATAFSGLSETQINWKPSADSWSIAQCLEHLMIADACYFPVFEKIMAGHYKISFWEKYSPFTALCGRLLKNQLREEVKRKMIAPKKIRPAFQHKLDGFISEYLDNLSRFLAYIENCAHADPDKIILTSPTIPIVTYSLRDALQFLVQHEHRHINQAIRVKQHASFPAL